MKKILLTGGNGMLASDFKKIASSKYQIISCSRDDLDITSLSEIRKIVEINTPDIIFNCAAYTYVDDAEDIGKKKNFDINALGVANIAQICGEKKIDFITISTDYVFNGEKTDGYNEADLQNPINLYGLAKYLGEKLAQNIYSETIIIRTSWLYGGGKEFKNFVNTMLKISEKKHELQVVNDQFGIPTHCISLAKAIVKVLEDIEKYKGQILHFSDYSKSGISWHEFAKKIFEIKNIEINVLPCASDTYNMKALRPKYSVLKNNSDIHLENWEKSLEKYLIN